MSIEFVIAGDPVAWQRTDGNGKRRFTPRRTRMQKELVAAAARIAGAVPLAGPMKLTVFAFRASARRCDWDNLGKLVSDALNGVCWFDDSQVVDARVVKLIDRERPRTEVTVEPSVLELVVSLPPPALTTRRRLVSSIRSPA